jgi:hypothetical protein
LISSFLSSLVFAICGFLIGFLKPEKKVTRQMSVALFVIAAFMLMVSTKIMSSFLQGLDYSCYLILWLSYPTVFPLAYSAASEFPPNVSQSRFWVFTKYFLYILSAAIFLGLQASLFRSYGVDTYFPFIKSLFSNDLFLKYFDFIWDLLIQFSLLMIILVIIRNYRSVVDLDQRRRIKWVAYSSIFGLLPSLISHSITFLRGTTSYKYETSDYSYFLFARFAEFSITALPISIAY